MQAIRFHEHGDANVLEQENSSVPQPESNEILIDVEAAGVNPIDWKTR